MRELKELYIKEMKGEKTALLGYVTGIVAIFFISMILKVYGIDFYVVLLLMLNLTPFWFFAISYDFLAREWKEGSVAFWTTIPVQPWKLIAAKMMAACTVLLIVGGLLTVSILALNLPETIPLVQPAAAFLVYLILLLPLAPVAFGVYMSGTSIAVLPWLVRFFTAVVLLGVVVIPVYFHMNYIMKDINKSEITIPYTIDNILSLPIGLYLAGVLGFILATRLLEKRPLP